MSQQFTIGARTLSGCARCSKKHISVRPFSTILLSAILFSAASASADMFTLIGEVPQIFAASTTGIYLITAEGASGGNEQYKYYGKNCSGGEGAVEVGKFALSAGTTLSITVGGKGGNGSSSFEEYGGGGGGGESVVSSESSGLSLLIAGGMAPALGAAEMG